MSKSGSNRKRVTAAASGKKLSVKKSGRFIASAKRKAIKL